MLTTKKMTGALLLFSALVSPLSYAATALDAKDAQSVQADASSPGAPSTQDADKNAATSDDANQAAQTEKTAPTANLVEKAPIEDRTYTFKQLSYAGSIRMQGSQSNAYIGFGSRLDEIITQGKVNFDFIASPALLAEVSHIKLYLNDELMGVVALDKDMLGKKVHASLDLDPRLFADYNQLRFELIGSLDTICKDPDDFSIWAELSQESNIELKVQKTQLKNDLSLLPAPFFDARDFTDVTIPMVVGDNIDLDEVKALGVAASYFGTLADWRPTDFPIHFDIAPKQNSVVLVTNDNKPEFLKNLPDAKGPSIQVITNPANHYSKLLLVTGRDGKDLVKAMQGLAFGQSLMTGSYAQIDQVTQMTKRKPYDAPNWIDTTRPVTFSELAKQESDLQVEGKVPPPILLNFRLPPDLFTWQSRGIPMDLIYRYTPPLIDSSGSRMSLSLNGGFVKAFNLSKEGHSDHNSHLRLPLIDDNYAGAGDRVRIPSFKVGSQNEVKFEFEFANTHQASVDGTPICQSSFSGKQYAAIDPSSSIDFSGFANYIEMPNLRTFAHAGYPFSRMADLSETVAVFPKQLDLASIQTFTNVMGFLGAQTGYPGANIELTQNWDTQTLADKDILAIGFDPSLQDISKDNSAKSLLEQGARLLQVPMKNSSRDNKDIIDPDMQGTAVSDQVVMSAQGDFAAITSQESPFTKNRTQVSLLGNSADALNLINTSLQDKGKADAMFGSVIAIRSTDVSSYDVGEHYYVGELPLLDLIWYHFSKYPWLIASIAIVVVVMASVVLWRVLKRIARRRLAMEDDA
ncbi:MAG: cellulose biosynthesis cyclic di-GMP-binding regulatory protein BcsB [Vibrio sp.]